MLHKVRRGLSPIVAVLLLMILVVVIAIVFYVWLPSYMGGVESSAGSTKREFVKIDGVSVAGGNLKIYARNIFDVKVTVDRVYFLSPSGMVLYTYDLSSPVTMEPGQVATITIPVPTELRNSEHIVVKLGSTEGTGSNGYPVNFKAVGQTWVSGWSYRRKIDITENSGSNLYDYQVRIILDSTTLDSPADFFSKATPDDIRFTDSTGVNFLSFYIEYWNAAEQKAVVWVKVPILESSSTTTIYLYYGNPTATSASNGYDTCELFEDFEEYSVGSHASPPWIIFTTSALFPYVPADFIVENIFGQNSYKILKSSTAYPGGAYRSYAGSSYVVTGKVMDYTGTSNNPHPGVIFALADTDNWDGIYLREGWDQIVWARVRGGSWSAARVWSQPINRGEWYRIMVKVNGGTAQVYFNDQYVDTITGIITPTNGIGFLFFNSGWDYGYFDNLCVAKYVVPEPTYIIGPEETTP